VIRYNIQHPVFNDRDFEYWDAHSINCWPSILVIGPDGKQLAMMTGEDNRDDLKGLLEAALELYGGILERDTEVPFLSEMEKQSQDDAVGSKAVTPEEVRAVRQNLNNPGKVIVVKNC